MAIQEIFLLHHSHVDVGYTDLAPVIARRHVEYLDQVLDLCTRTEGYPDDARFRWVSEFSWPVVEYLRQRPARAGELCRRLCEGRIELGALFLDPTELMDRRSFEVSLTPALGLAAKHGFTVTTAMTVDVPGQGWSLAEVLAAKGIPYLSVCPNAMVSKPLQVVPPFWWVGPEGGRVLVWQTDWRKGWYGAGHVLGYPRGYAVARDNTLAYVRQLEAEGYRWSVLALHYAADNYPPAADLSDIVRQWNAEGGLPRMRLATHAEFFARLLECHGRQFPEHQLAWPDWWSEGLGSAAYETALSRETHCRMLRLEALLAALGETRDLWPVWEELLLFDEHTWGCSAMATEPFSFAARASWHYKAAHIYTACDQARRLEAELGRRLAERQRPAATSTAQGGVTLLNPGPDNWCGPVQLPAAAATWGAAQADGCPLAVDRTPATRLAPVRAWVQVAVQAGGTLALTQRDGEAAAPVGAANAGGAGRLENRFYRLEYDAAGRCTRLLDREAGAELLDTRSPWGFAEVIHERIASPEDRAAVWERGYLELPYGKRRTDAPFVRCGSLAAARQVANYAGPLCCGIVWQSALPDAPSIETEVRLWREAKRIDIEVRLEKAPQRLHEGLYVAFPFRLDNPRGFVHSCDAVFEVERQQLPGTCRDFYAVEHMAALQGDQGWAVLCPVEAPLVTFGQLTFGQWLDHLQLTRGCLYSWLLNNFWYTNFPGYQLGELHFRFALTTGAGQLDGQAAVAFGRQVRQGLTVA
jgi:hypothetical protein